MNKDVYLFDILRCDRAQDLHNFRDFARTDPALDDAARAEINAAIDQKFGRLNQRAAGQQKPRW